MMKIFLSGLTLLLIISTDISGQEKKNRIKVSPDTVAVDSTEYELLIFDPGFDSWLATKPSVNFYSKSYYESWNRLYVMEWNSRYMARKPRDVIFETWIDYDPKVDYGLDLNYRLFYYFRYFEETNKLKLVNSIR
jgi:hypothetical protein